MIKLTHEEKEAIINGARKSGMSISEYVRTLLLEAKKMNGKEKYDEARV